MKKGGREDFGITMADIKTTENEFRSQAVTWLNEYIAQGATPFEMATSDPSLKSESGVSFPDIQIWLNRQARQGFCGLELKTPKTPKTPIDDPELLNSFWVSFP